MSTAEIPSVASGLSRTQAMAPSRISETPSGRSATIPGLGLGLLCGSAGVPLIRGTAGGGSVGAFFAVGAVRSDGSDMVPGP